MRLENRELASEIDDIIASNSQKMSVADRELESEIEHY